MMTGDETMKKFMKLMLIPMIIIIFAIAMFALNEVLRNRFGIEFRDWLIVMNINLFALGLILVPVMILIGVKKSENETIKNYKNIIYVLTSIGLGLMIYFGFITLIFLNSFGYQEVEVAEFEDGKYVVRDIAFIMPDHLYEYYEYINVFVRKTDSVYTDYVLLEGNSFEEAVRAGEGIRGEIRYNTD